MTHLIPYIKDIDRFPLLSPERERELGLLIAAGDQAAWRELVNCNLRLAFSLARDWPIRSYGRVDRQDLIQSANVGLMRAARDFDPGRGTRFCTYAGYWIKHEIRRFCRERCSVIHIPSYVWALVFKYHCLLDCPGGDHASALDALDLSPQRREKLLKALEVLGEVQVGEPGHFGVNSWEQVAPTADPGLPWDHEGTSLPAFLGVLNDQEYEVIVSRFGLDGRPVETLASLGRRFGWYPDRTRRIEKRALAKLKASLGVSA